MVRAAPHYRRAAMVAGLQAIGFDVLCDTYPNHATPGDVVVVWNRYAIGESAAKLADQRGATVIVAENRYIGRTDAYALSLDQHNGAGRWPGGDRERASAQGIELKPWRESGGHILVLPQRGIGPAGVAMPVNWTEGVVARLRKMTGRQIMVRPHPGRAGTDRPLWLDLHNAHAAVTWGSGAAIHALALGYPVFHDMPQWIGAPAAIELNHADIEVPWMGDRWPMFERLSGAQASLDEITSGLAFERLLYA